MKAPQASPFAQEIRILAVSDDVVSALFHDDVAARVGSVDLLLSCGDLPYSYLEYLVTKLHVRHALFVHGNHDNDEYCASGKTLTEPGGWKNIDMQSTWIKEQNLLVGGLEGSIRYRPDALYQYTQAEMAFRVRRLALHLLFNRIRHGRYLDIFIAHSPPAGIHDGPDGPHQGFRSFPPLLRRFRPRLMLHGHKHRYGPRPWKSTYIATEIVNAHPFRIIRWREDGLQYSHFHRR